MILVLIMSFMFSCNQSTKEYSDIIEKGDVLTALEDLKQIKLYVKTLEHSYKRVTDINSFHEEYLKFYNVFESKDINVVKVFMDSESGDYTCQSDNYYKDGNLKVLINYCTFFNSICEEILTQKTTNYYNNGKLISQQIQFLTENKEVKNTSGCVINYSCPIEPLFDYSFLF